MNNREQIPTKDKNFYTELIKHSGILGELSFANVFTSKKKPKTSVGPNFRNVLLDRNYCDIYLIPGENQDNLLDVYIHIKESSTSLKEEIDENIKEKRLNEEASLNPLSTDNWQSDKNQADAEKGEKEDEEK